MLTPLSPENSMEGPGTVGEGTPLATSGGAERRAAHKLTLLTTNSGAGLRTEGPCPPLTPGAKPGRGDTLRLAPLLPEATTKEPEPRGDRGSSTSGTNLGEGRTLAPPSANPENAEPEARGNKTADNWPIETFIAARSDSTATNLLAQGASEAGSSRRECFSLEPPYDLAHFFSLAECFSASFTYAWNWRRESLRFLRFSLRFLMILSLTLSVALVRGMSLGRWEEDCCLRGRSCEVLDSL
ncbi:hypothetical protein E2C01_035071 [Portunus trituberculatus]|uniref:Uncharacterized protein n=1 Tax=Portunus trituberculatus TaxID=210409 RepID=A0A5B7F8Q9_PORTR|nr:hypothetical protein [Portunus trituberculatus]